MSKPFFKMPSIFQLTLGAAALFCLPLNHSMAYAGGTSVRVNTLSPVKTGIEEVVEIDESVQSFQSHVSKVVSEVSGAVIKLFNVNDRTGERRFTGSAVVVSPDGLVLTVAHVNVPGRVFVGTFPDGREVRVVGLGEINSMDAAMMRIEEKGNYPYVKLGYSSGLKHGEPVIAFGYAGGLQHSFPAPRLGFVVRQNSSVRRDTTQRQPQLQQQTNRPAPSNRGMRAERLQTTCIMEPGDSGGAVFDLNGHLIGLRSSINQSLDVNLEIPIDHYHKYWHVMLGGEEFRSAPDSLAVPINQIAKSADFHAQHFSPYSDTTNVFKQVFAKRRVPTYMIESESGDSTLHIHGTPIELEGLRDTRSRRNKSYLLSKSSMVGNNPAVIGIVNKPISAKVIRRDEQNDLVLLEIVKPKGYVGIALDAAPDSVSFNTIGQFVNSPLATGTQKISVLGTSPFAIPGQSRFGYFGAALNQTDEGVVFQNVQPNSPAGQAKFKPGMKLLSLDGEQILSPVAFVNKVQSKRPGDKVLVEYASEDQVQQIEIVLAKRPLVAGSHIAERFEGGKSVVRDGFERVFAHDGRLLPSEMGTPLIGMDGTLYGINIARISRTSTLALPMDVVKSFLHEAIDQLEK